ncbi:unnamed protein product [Amaranthus hypochondriacus]
MKSPISQESGSSYSSSLQISEPPDIKEWFASYTYQSPVLDTNEDLCLSHGDDNEENGLYVEDSEYEEEKIGENLRKRNHSGFLKSAKETRKHEVSSLPASEVPGDPELLSFTSEPPDITNWFSSYVYESPELDSSDFDFSLSNRCTFGNNDKGKESSETKVKDELLSCSETIARDSEIKNKNPSTLQEDGSERGNMSSEKGWFSARTCNPRTYIEKISDCDTNSTKSGVCPTIKSEDMTAIVQENQLLSSTNHLRSPIEVSLSVSNESEKKGGKKFEAAENEGGWISVNGKRREENEVRSIKNERKEYTSAETELSSKRKANTRENKENSPVKSGLSPDGQKRGMLRREILRETTNFEHSRVPVVSGKWRCPQKFKPDLGPPLKQLRFEKWVHRK